MNKMLVILASIGALFTCCQKSNEKALVIILLGPPGAGKGTQAQELSKKLKIPHISTGDLFRENLSKQTEIGKKAKSFMDAGKLVPDEIVLEMVSMRLKNSDCKGGYILDGFPRTINQAIALDKELDKNSKRLAINIDVKDDLLLKRITGRLVCKSCGAVYHKTLNPPEKPNVCDHCHGELIQRKDDTEPVVKERLKVYHEQTEPLIEYYKKEKIFHEVNGNQDKDKVLSDILKITK